MAKLAGVVDHIGRYLEAHWEAIDSPGLSLGVTDRDGLLGVVTHGFANLDAGLPVAP